MKNKCLYFALATMLTACGTNQSNTDKVTYLSKDDLPPLQQLNLEQIPLPEENVMGAYNYLVYHDSVLIIKYDQPHPHFFTIMNLNTKDIVGSYFAKGNGPGEMLFPLGWLQGNRVTIYDGSKIQLAVLNMDSLLRYRQRYKPEIIILSAKNGPDFEPFYALSDTSFICFNRWYMENCGNPVNENVPEFLKFGHNGQINFEAPEDAWVVYSCNYTRFASNLERDKIFVAYNYKPQFKLLDMNFDTIRVINGPDPVERQKYKNDIIGGLSSELHSDYAMDMTSTENFVFVLMDVSTRNLTGQEKFESRGKVKKELYKFDWDGNLLARYQLDSNLNWPAGYSESSNTLYIVNRDENGEKALFKAKL